MESTFKEFIRRLISLAKAEGYFTGPPDWSFTFEDQRETQLVFLKESLTIDKWMEDTVAKYLLKLDELSGLWNEKNGSLKLRDWKHALKFLIQDRNNQPVQWRNDTERNARALFEANRKIKVTPRDQLAQMKIDVILRVYPTAPKRRKIESVCRALDGALDGLRFDEISAIDLDPRLKEWKTTTGLRPGGYLGAWQTKCLKNKVAGYIQMIYRRNRH